MQVILLEKIQKLGDIGDLVNIKAGYARNFLVPQKKAKIATKENIAAFEKIKQELLNKQEKELTEAKAKKEAMQDTLCTISANATEDGKLFGSISPLDIVKNLKEQGFEVEKKDIHIPEAIRQVGEYEISISLYADIIINVKLLVKANTN